MQQTLSAAKPHLHTFVTLSPVPGFRGWLEARLALYAAQQAGEVGGRRGDPSAAAASFVSPDEALALSALQHALTAAELTAAEAFERLVDDDAVSHWLLRLCARYLCLSTKRRRAQDPVAAFHLRNGAELLALHWGANPSRRGLVQSAGIMANYAYVPSCIEANHSAYVKTGTVLASAAVRELAGDP